MDAVYGYVLSKVVRPSCSIFAYNYIPGFMHWCPQPLKQQILPPLHLSPTPHNSAQKPGPVGFGHGPTGPTSANIRQKPHFIYYASDNYKQTFTELTKGSKESLGQQ